MKEKSAWIVLRLIFPCQVVLNGHMRGLTMQILVNSTDLLKVICMYAGVFPPSASISKQLCADLLLHGSVDRSNLLHPVLFFTPPKNCIDILYQTFPGLGSPDQNPEPCTGLHAQRRLANTVCKVSKPPPQKYVLLAVQWSACIWNINSFRLQAGPTDTWRSFTSMISIKPD